MVGIAGDQPEIHRVRADAQAPARLDERTFELAQFPHAAGIGQPRRVRLLRGEIGVARLRRQHRHGRIAKRPVRRGGRAHQHHAFVDQRADEPAHHRIVEPRHEPGVVRRQAQVLRARQEGVFDRIDAEPRGFRASQRAEVAGHLQAVPVRLVDDRGRELRADRIVELERAEAAAGPIRGGGTAFLRRGEHGVAEEIAGRAVEVGAGEMHVRTRHEALVDASLEVAVDLRMLGARGAQAGHAGGEVQLRIADRL